jgi:acetylornithine deacetylase
MSTATNLGDYAIDTEELATLLGAIIGHSEFVQNNPPMFVPKEDLVADEVLAVLKPFIEPEGPLQVKRCTYVEGRSNLIVTLPSDASDKTVAFVGCHMDVVAANPEDWSKNPFEMERDGDKVWGRGVTDCLGHVAMMTLLMKKLAAHPTKLNRTVVAVFIANEEDSGILGIGIDEMMKQGELEMLKNGPVFWVDSADFGPTLGTGGMQTWEMSISGKKFHSGFPHKAVNPINFASTVIAEVQRRFYKDFPINDSAKSEYLFEIGCSMKPTQINTPPGSSINQIPQKCIVAGDIRITPFVKHDDIRKAVEGYVKDLNENPDQLECFGYEKYKLSDAIGKIELKWTSSGDMSGVAVKLDSPGHKALVGAVEAVRGSHNKFSLTGSLPVIGDLVAAGLDVQVTGFGRMDAYHAVDEYALLSELVQGSQVLFKVLDTIERS